MFAVAFDVAVTVAVSPFTRPLIASACDVIGARRAVPSAS